jgi:predicted RNase H-like HicB family nuclease
MTPTLVAGSLTEVEDPELKIVTEDDLDINLRYSRPAQSDNSYSVPLTGRLRALLRRGEAGWIAHAPELDALGHGETPQAALTNLQDSVEQYLEFLRDDKPALAPEISRHAAFVVLLSVPPGLWFASVSIDAPTVE